MPAVQSYPLQTQTSTGSISAASVSSCSASSSSDSAEYQSLPAAVAVDSAPSAPAAYTSAQVTSGGKVQNLKQMLGRRSIAMRNALSTASSGLSSSAHAASLPSAQPAIMNSPGKGHVNWAFFFSNVRCV